MCRTWPDANRPDDYVFRVDGKDAGRCYLTHAAGKREVWRWSKTLVVADDVVVTLRANRDGKALWENARIMLPATLSNFTATKPPISRCKRRPRTGYRISPAWEDCRIMLRAPLPAYPK